MHVCAACEFFVIWSLWAGLQAGPRSCLDKQCSGLCSRCRISRCFKRVLLIGIPWHLCLRCYVADPPLRRPAPETKEAFLVRLDLGDAPAGGKLFS